MNKIRNNKKTIISWAFYDWANSAYNLVITSTIFPAYYTAITSDNDKSTVDYVDFLGFKFVNSSLYSYSMAFAFLIIALISPILSSIADTKGNKKSFMKFFTYLGGLACCGLVFFDQNSLTVGIVFFILATLGFWGSLVFYNAYLPEIATVDQQDIVSAKGFTYGYIGSVILQLICFAFVFFPSFFGLKNEGEASRLSFFMVGVWWIGFAQIPFLFLPKSKQETKNISGNIFTDGFFKLKKVWDHAKHMKYLKRFLFAFFFYSMGVQTVMLVATLFGEQELNLGTEKLIATILILQLVAIPGALGMSYLAKNKFGNVNVLIGVVIIWIGACVGGYFVETEIQFYILAGMIGLVMGGIQSLSKSTYSKFLPQNNTEFSSYFSFYDVTEKVALVLGMFSFGFIGELFGMRNSVVVLASFFIIGLVFLFLLKRAEPKNLKAVA